jgi:hypothetical protein
MCRTTEGKGRRWLNTHRLGVVCVSSGRGWRCEGLSYSGHASHPWGACRQPWRLVRTAEGDWQRATRNRRPSRQEAVLPERYLVAARPNNCMASVRRVRYALVTAQRTRPAVLAPRRAHRLNSGAHVQHGSPSGSPTLAANPRRPVPHLAHTFRTPQSTPRPSHGQRRDACTLTSPHATTAHKQKHQRPSNVRT